MNINIPIICAQDLFYSETECFNIKFFYCYFTIIV